MGMISAFTIRYKIALKEIVSHELSWDDALPESLNQKWRQLAVDLVESGDIVFPRTVQPDGVTGAPELISFWDGSDLAFGGVIYIRWKKVDSDDWHVALLASKARVTPKANLSTPRSELNGLVVLVRLLNTIIPALSVPPSRISIIGDSTCTIAAANYNAAALAAFFSNRVVEIIDVTNSWGLFNKLNPKVEHVPESDPTYVVIFDNLSSTLGLISLGTLIFWLLKT